MKYLGDFSEDQTVYLLWETHQKDGASVTHSGATVRVYKDNSTTEITAGVSVSYDFDGITGVHLVTITTTDAAYVTGSDYNVVVVNTTVDSVAFSSVLATFSIENRFMRGTDSAATPADVASAQSSINSNVNSQHTTTRTTVTDAHTTTDSNVNSKTAATNSKVDTNTTHLTDIKGTGFTKDTHSLPQCLTGTTDVAGIWSGITAAAMQSIADEVLKRDFDNVEDSLPRHSLGTMAMLHMLSDTTTNTGKLTVFRTDGTTELFQFTLSTVASADDATGLNN